MSIYQTKYSANEFWNRILYHVSGGLNANGVASMSANDPAWNQDVVNKIVSAGFFDSVDPFNVSMEIPAPSVINSYKGILVYADDTFANPDEFGDSLANYVDAGGGVVVATFAVETYGQLGGRWLSDGYYPVTLGDQVDGTPLTLGTVAVPSHPVMNGVSTFDGGGASFYGNSPVNGSNATLIASWSNDVPLVVERTGLNGKIIILNFYPPSSDVREDFWQVNTDGAKLMSNALKYVAGF